MKSSQRNCCVLLSKAACKTWWLASDTDFQFCFSNKNIPIILLDDNIIQLTYKTQCGASRGAVGAAEPNTCPSGHGQICEQYWVVQEQYQKDGHTDMTVCPGKCHQSAYEDRAFFPFLFHDGVSCWQATVSSPNELSRRFSVLCCLFKKGPKARY